jgi:hypothetical protein
MGSGLIFVGWPRKMSPDPFRQRGGRAYWGVAKR